MTKICNDKDMALLESMFLESKGRGIELAKPNAAAMKRAVRAGYIRKVRSDFFCEKGGQNLVVFTGNGKRAMLRRLCSRHPMDFDDAYHLVRTGSFDLAALSSSPRAEAIDAEAQLEAFDTL